MGYKAQNAANGPRCLASAVTQQAANPENACGARLSLTPPGLAACLQHGLGDAAQDVDFLLAQISPVEQLLQSRHQFFRRGRIQITNRLQAMLPMLQHGLYRLGIGAAHACQRGLGSTVASRRTPSSSPRPRPSSSSRHS